MILISFPGALITGRCLHPGGGSVVVGGTQDRRSFLWLRYPGLLPNKTELDFYRDSAEDTPGSLGGSAGPL